MKSLFAGFVLAAALPFAAMAKDSTVKSVNYGCADNGILRAVYMNGKNNQSYVVILQNDELVVLKETRSASGMAYKAVDSNYNYKLAGKGDEVSLFAGDKPVLTECKP